MLIDRLLAEVLDRPRIPHDDLEGWRQVEQPVRLVQARGRLVDISRRPSTVHYNPKVLPHGFAEHELARPWLSHIHRECAPRRGMGAKRVPWRKDALPMLDVLPPRWWCPPDDGAPWRGELAYVDIDRAYHSLWSPLALDMHWRPDDDCPRLGVGRMPMLGAGELDDAKEVQRGVAGIIRATRMLIYERGAPTHVDTTGWSRHLCPDLWGVVQWSLHSIAQTAVSEYGCEMWVVDGGVMPVGDAERFARWLADAWGLSSHVRWAGEARVWGVGSWECAGSGSVVRGRVRRPQKNLLPISTSCAKVLQRARSAATVGV